MAKSFMGRPVKELDREQSKADVASGKKKDPEQEFKGKKQKMVAVNSGARIGNAAKRRSTSDGYMPRQLTPKQKEDRQIKRMLAEAIKETLNDTPENRDKAYMKSRGLTKADVKRGQVS